MERDYSDFRNCINYLLTVSQHEVFQQLATRLAPLGITPGQYGVLNCLWQNGEATPKEIAQELCLENSTISGVLDRMQKKGLIDRLMDENDRRSIRVIATEGGKALKEVVLRTVTQVNNDFFRTFDERDAEIFLSCLRRIGQVD